MRNKKIVQILTDKMDYYLEMIRIAKIESQPSYVLKYENAIDEIISIACKFLDADLINHKDYHFLYDTQMNYIKRK